MDAARGGEFPAQLPAGSPAGGRTERGIERAHEARRRIVVGRPEAGHQRTHSGSQDGPGTVPAARRPEPTPLMPGVAGRQADQALARASSASRHTQPAVRQSPAPSRSGCPPGTPWVARCRLSGRTPPAAPVPSVASAPERTSAPGSARNPARLLLDPRQTGDPRRHDSGRSIGATGRRRRREHRGARRVRDRRHIQQDAVPVRQRRGTAPRAADRAAPPPGAGRFRGPPRGRQQLSPTASSAWFTEPRQRCWLARKNSAPYVPLRMWNQNQLSAFSTCSRLAIVRYTAKCSRRTTKHATSSPRTMYSSKQVVSSSVA